MRKGVEHERTCSACPSWKGSSPRWLPLAGLSRWTGRWRRPRSRGDLLRGLVRGFSAVGPARQCVSGSVDPRLTPPVDVGTEFRRGGENASADPAPQGCSTPPHCRQHFRRAEHRIYRFCRASFGGRVFEGHLELHRSDDTNCDVLNHVGLVSGTGFLA